jgi:hypothetical protein
MAAYCFLADRRVDRNSHRELTLIALGTHGDEKALKDAMENWESENS